MLTSAGEPGNGRLQRLWRAQWVRYAAVGSFNTGFGYLLFAALHLSVGRAVPYLVVLVVSFTVATTVAFFVHRRITFRSAVAARRSLPRYIAISAALLAANGVLLSAFVEWVGLPVLVAQFAVVLIVAAGGYLAHARLSFKEE